MFLCSAKIAHFSKKNVPLGVDILNSMRRIIFILLIMVLLPLFAVAQSNTQGVEEYVTKSKETIYSISRSTGVKVSDILDLNPGLTRLTKLKLGQIIKLPANYKSVVQQPVVPENIVTTPNDSYKDVRIPATFVDTARVDNGKIVIALLLPFYAKESGFSELEGVTDARKVPSRSLQFLQFYEGALMALDSLKNRGLNVEYQVFDIGRGVDILSAEMGAINELNPNVIIGPVYEEQAKLLCDSLHNKSIPVIYPLSSRSSKLANYPNLVVLNISDRSLAVEMASWLQNEIIANGANAIFFDIKNSLSGLTKSVVESVASLPGVIPYQWNSAIDADSNATFFRSYLKPDVENYIVLASEKEAELSRVLPVLLLCKDEYKITLVGLPDWQTYTVLDMENYYRLNLTFFAYSYTDGNSEKMRRFSNAFINYFGEIPSNLACKGFDTALMFGDLADKFTKGVYMDMNGVSMDGLFSAYRFATITNGGALENRALLKITYGRDYKIHINKAN